MMSRFLRYGVFGLVLGAAAGMGACGSSEDGSQFQPGADASADGGGGDDATMPGDDGGVIIFDSGGGAETSSDAMLGFDVQPGTLQTIQVTAGQTMPTVVYTATLNGHPINAAWSIDRGDLGAVATGPSNTTTFTPTGRVGGLVTIVAGLNGQTIKRQVLVQLGALQNGPNSGVPAEVSQIATSVGQLTAGGGIGGVGGEGLGVAVTDQATLTALGAPANNGQTQALKFLYPYDKTVWPRGLLAPLLQWDWSIGDADAIQIHLETTSKSFSWTGTFARPAILGANGKFIRHPIPQDIWDMATNSAGGPTSNNMTDKLTVTLVVAKAAQAYGPITETWTIAPARLSGIIYYNSYGTQLAQNFTGAVGGNGKFGGAVLSIHVGDTAPQLTAGATGGIGQCRVCHSVAAGGSRLIVQHGDAYGTSSAYDLTPTTSTEVPLANGTTFPAMYPDGSKALSPNGQMLTLPSSTVVATTGITTYSTNLGAPAFSPDGKLVVFNPMAGPTLTNPTQKLVLMNFDNATNAFTNPVVVVDDTGSAAETRPGWSAFLPDGKSVVFHHQSAAGFDGNSEGQMSTRKGAKAQIAWTGITGSTMVTPLNQLNGTDGVTSYLPKLATASTLTCTGDGSQVGNINADHGDDVNLNYEPTVNPVASGGYAWVVFTSRRMYGNEATIPPFCSDPRGVDLIQNITTKKLWVAAIDLGAAPGTDASHPAFYLPAQELLAGNSRGFWVLDPCRMDGQTCMTGDQCCNGYCEPGDGGLVCSNTPPNTMCSQPQEKCTTTADCCDPTNTCIGGFCTLAGPH